jgi:S-adenosylhomocysteine hydrolase
MQRRVPTVSTIQTLKHWDLNDTIPFSMPILDRWLKTAAQNRPLAGVTALLIQHQLGNHVPQARALIQLGISPEDIYWIDIPYTSTAVVREAVKGLGVPEDNLITSKFRLLDNYARFQRLRVQSFLRTLFDHPPERLLVLDDGAYMLEALAFLRTRLPGVAIVEQTTRGLIKIEESIALEYCSKELPIVNVARSKPKASLEPPFIGAAVCDALRRKLRDRLFVGPNDHCLVLGYGAIGKQVAAFLNDLLSIPRDHVHIYDILKERVENAVADGFKKWSRDDRDLRFKLVIGCSGRDSFKLGDYVLLDDGAFLASATSGTVELSREYFIELAEASPYDDIWIDREHLDERNVHSDLSIHFVDREVTFLNGGFPVNFDGRVNCVPAHYIQPTQTMMCAAAVQAIRSKEKGLIDLDPSFCAWLTEEFKKELGDEASLLLFR